MVHSQPLCRTGHSELELRLCQVIHTLYFLCSCNTRWKLMSITVKEPNFTTVDNIHKTYSQCYNDIWFIECVWGYTAMFEVCAPCPSTPQISSFLHRQRHNFAKQFRLVGVYFFVEDEEQHQVQQRQWQYIPSSPPIWVHINYMGHKCRQSWSWKVEGSVPLLNHYKRFSEFLTWTTRKCYVIGHGREKKEPLFRRKPFHAVFRALICSVSNICVD